MSKILNQQLYSTVVYGSESANGTLRLEATSSATKGAVQAVATAFELIVASTVARITHSNTTTRNYTLPNCSGEILVSGRFLSTGDIFYGGTTPGTAEVLNGVPAGALTTNQEGVPQWSAGNPGQVLTIDASTRVPSFKNLPDTGTIADASANTLPYYAVAGNDLVPLTTVANRVLSSPNGVPSWVLLSSNYLRTYNGSALGAGTAGFTLSATGDGGFVWTEPVSASIIAGAQYALPYYSLAGSGSTISASQFLYVNEASRALELKNQGRFRMYEAVSNGTNYLEFRAPGSIGPNVIWVLPSADGAANSSLITDGFGNLSFADLGSVGNGAASQLAYYAVNGNDLTNLVTAPDRALLSNSNSSFAWSLIGTKYLSTDGGAALNHGSYKQILISNGSGEFVWADAIDVSGIVESGTEGYVSFYPTTGRSVRATSFVRASELNKTLTLDASSSLSFAATSGSGSVSLRARGSLLETGLVLDLPQADGLDGHALITDGSGLLSFIEVGRGTVAPTLASGSLAYYTGTTPGGHGQLEALVSGPDEVMLSNASNQATWGLLEPKHLNTPVSIFDNDVLTVESGEFSWKNPASLVGNVQEGVASFVAYYPSDGRELNDSGFMKVNEAQKAIELRSGGLGVKFYDSTDQESVSLRSPATIDESLSFTLPGNDGTQNQALVTNGNGELFFTSLDYIGEAEDGSYSDGLFTDFESATKIGTAVDRFNETLKALAPPAPPVLTSISLTSGSGVEGKLSFGISAPIAGYTNVEGGIADWPEIDINGLATLSSSTMGIYAPRVQSGVLASDVSAHSFAYPANAFADGDKGSLALLVNEVVVHSIDLSSFISGLSANANGSGFTLSAATSVKFSEGSDLPLFKYRTGSWEVSPADQRNGWNYLRVRHTVGSSVRYSNYFEWVNDADTTATSFEAASLSSLALTGSRFLSGVKYYMSGQASYGVTVKNAYKNSYSISPVAVSYPITTNCAVTSGLLTQTSSATNDFIVTSKTVTILPDSNNRILGGDLGVSTEVLRTVQSSVVSAVTEGGWKILLDAGVSQATDLYEDFLGETYRRVAAIDTSLTNYEADGTGPGSWNSTALLTGDLLVYDGSLRYPTNTFSGGDFRNVTEGNPNGPSNPGGPLGNPDYSAMSGEKVYLRYFYFQDAEQNFDLEVTSEDTEFVPSSSQGSLTGNQVTMEILAPNTTRDSSGTIVWKDCVTPYTHDSGVGAYAATFGSSIPSSWGLTLGTKSTATSGFAVLLRITAPETWTGNISELTLLPL